MSQPDPVAAAFDQVESIAGARRRFPDLRLYCEKILGVRFNGDGCHAHCPMHGGHTGQAFCIDPRTQKWTCFSDCDRSGDVLDLHYLYFDFASLSEAMEHLLALELPARPDQTNIFSLPPRRERPGPAIPPEAKLIRGVE